MTSEWPLKKELLFGLTAIKFYSVLLNKIVQLAEARDETDDVLPDKDVAKEFYAKYEPKEILGRWPPHCLIVPYLIVTYFFTFINFFWYFSYSIEELVQQWDDVLRKRPGKSLLAKLWTSMEIHLKMKEQLWENPLLEKLQF